MVGGCEGFGGGHHSRAVAALRASVVLILGGSKHDVRILFVGGVKE